MPSVRLFWEEDVWACVTTTTACGGVGGSRLNMANSPDSMPSSWQKVVRACSIKSSCGNPATTSEMISITSLRGGHDNPQPGQYGRFVVMRVLHLFTHTAHQWIAEVIETVRDAVGRAKGRRGAARHAQQFVIDCGVGQTARSRRRSTSASAIGSPRKGPCLPSRARPAARLRTGRLRLPPMEESNPRPRFRRRPRCQTFWTWVVRCLSQPTAPASFRSPASGMGYRNSVQRSRRP